MKPAQELLLLLAQRKILLANDSGKLRFKVPKNALDENIKGLIREQRSSLLDTLALYSGFNQLAPLSYNQQSLYFAQQQEPDSSAYNLAVTVKLCGKPEVTLLQRALQNVLQDNSQLRSRFTFFGEGAEVLTCQVIPETLEPKLTECNLTTLAPSEQIARIQDDYDAPIHLSSGVGFETCLYQLAEQDWVFFLKVHHIAVDGWSLKLLIEQLQLAYNNESTGEPHQEPISTAGDYLDFCCDQHRALQHNQLKTCVEFWEQQLTPAPPPLEFNTLKPRPPQRRSAGDTLYFSIEKSLQNKLTQHASRTGTSTTAVLLSAFTRLLHHFAESADITVGIPTLGQRSGNHLNTIGYFVNPVALRSRLAGEDTLQSHLQASFNDLADAVDHRALPFTAVSSLPEIPHDAAHTPVFQALFNHLTPQVLGNLLHWLYPWKTPQAAQFMNCEAAPFALKQQQGQFDLSLEWIDNGETWLGLFKYNTDLFTAEIAQTWVDRYKTLLEESVAAPDAPALLNAQQSPRNTLVLAATFTAEPLHPPLQLLLNSLQLNTHIEFAPYNQVLQSLLNPNSLVRNNTNGAGVLLIRLQDVLTKHDADSEQYALATLEDFATAIENSIDQLATPLVVHLCPSNADFQESALADAFEARLSRIPGLSLLSREQFQTWYPVNDPNLPREHQAGAIPYKAIYYDALATALTRRYFQLRTPPIKALIIDCDNTLWEGVVGELGVDHLVIGEQQRKFQRFLLERFNRGIILCLCSKNNASDVWQVFEQRPNDMVLKKEHFSFSQINWQSKSSNIQTIATDMNIATDAMAFLDDSDMERAEVASQIPGICIVEFPLQWHLRTPYLKQFWPLDTRVATAADTQRAKHYRNEGKRKSLQQSQHSWEDFIDSLQLDIDIQPASHADIERLSQLSLRTNQFNTCLVRMSPGEVSGWIEDDARFVLKVIVSDRFGDYGLVGAMFCERQYCERESGTLVVSSLMLSCRALGRTVEFHMLHHLAKCCNEQGLQTIQLHFAPAERNQPVREFLEVVAQHGQPSNKAAPVAFPLEISAQYTANLPITANDASPRESAPKPAAIAKKSHWPHFLNDIASQRNEHNGYSELSNRHTETTFTHQNSTLTQQIKSIWESVLQKPIQDLNATFFNLGGNSLLLAQTAIAMKQAGISLELTHLFQYPSVAAIAAYVGGRTPGATPVATLTHDTLATPYQRLRDYRRN